MASDQYKNLTWKGKGAFQKELTICENETELGQLNRKSVWSGGAEGSINGLSCSFLPSGSINKTITVKDQQTSLGEMEISWLGNHNGEFKLTTGRKYIWKCKDFFRGQWVWEDEKIQKVLTFSPDDLMNQSGRIEINSVNSEDQNILILLGLHLKQLFNYWILTIAFLLIILLLRNT